MDMKYEQISEGRLKVTGPDIAVVLTKDLKCCSFVKLPPLGISHYHTKVGLSDLVDQFEMIRNLMEPV